jgi:hypothetical protein
MFTQRPAVVGEELAQRRRNTPAVSPSPMGDQFGCPRLEIKPARFYMYKARASCTRHDGGCHVVSVDVNTEGRRQHEMTLLQEASEYSACRSPEEVD